MALNRDASSKISAAVVAVFITVILLSVIDQAYPGSSISILSPPLLTKPSYELSRKDSNEKWAFADVSILIGRALKSQISKHTLIPMITGHIRKKGPVGRMLLEGFDLSRIEEVRDRGVIKEFSIPVRRNNGSVERLTYSLTDDGLAGAAIPIDKSTSVYIKREKIAAREEKIGTEPETMPEGPEIRASIFYDLIKRIQAQEGAGPIIIALGTTWIKGYEHDSFPQHNALNPLLTHIRGFCSSRNVSFLVRKDKELIDAIRAEKAKEANGGAKVIVLAGVGAVGSKEFEPLRTDSDVFIAGVNNKYLTVDSNTRLMEILTLTLELAFNIDEAIGYPDIRVIKHKIFPGLYILFPFAFPLDYEELRSIYKLQEAV